MRRLGSLIFVILVAATAIAPALGKSAPPDHGHPAVTGSVPASAADLAEVARRMRRLHLATVGLDAALGRAQVGIERAVSLQDEAGIERSHAALRVGQMRAMVAARAGLLVSASRKGWDRRAVAVRRAASLAQRHPWVRAEQALRDAEAAGARHADELARGQKLASELDRRTAMISRQRDEVDDAPLAVLAMTARRIRQELQDDQIAGLGMAGPPLGQFAPSMAPATLLTSLDAGREAFPVPAEDPVPGWTERLFSGPPPETGSGAPGLMDRGLVLEAAAGEEILAPDAGKIVFAGVFRSYGQILIIDHGDGYHTLMAGFSRLDVEVGTKVRAGERIGSVDGMKDASGVPGRLYVEVRRRGVPVDPMPWFAAREDKVRG